MRILFTLFILLTPLQTFAASQFIELAFSPHAGATKAVVRLIDQAQKSISIAAYNFTSKDIAKALASAQNRGVNVRAVLDKSNVHARQSSATFLANADIPVRIDYKYHIMHNKFIIVDGATVETGSFNYTSNAENSNAENIIILRNYPDVAQKYDLQWQKLWDESEKYSPKE